MNDVVERVARAMADGDWNAASFLDTPSGETPEEFREYWRSRARAAVIETLKSLREPTPQMLAAVDAEASDKFVARGRAYSAWVSMINAALADASPDIGKEGIGNDGE